MKFQELEQLRREYKKKLIVWWIVIFFIVTVVISFATGLSHIIILVIVAIFSAFFSFAFSFLFTRKVAIKYNKAYKAYFVESTLAKTFTDLKYNHAEGFSQNFIHTTGLLSIGDRFNSNDLTIGKYKDIQFSQADIRVEEESTDSEGHTSYTTIFCGRYIIYEFNRDFNFNLMIFGKRFVAAGNGGFGQKRKYEKIKTESTDFNKCFRIYAQDGFETFYILDPAFIEKIQQLYDYSKGRIALGFIDKKLHIAISNGKDSFEAPYPFKKLDEKAEFDKVLADTKIITDFVDTLRLDKNIFKK